MSWNFFFCSSSFFSAFPALFLTKFLLITNFLGRSLKNKLDTLQQNQFHLISNWTSFDLFTFIQLLPPKLSTCLDIAFPTSVFAFAFFFFFWRAFLTFCSCDGFPMGPVHCSRDPQTSFFNTTFIKNGSHSTIHTLKNYFATVFSVFSKINGIQMNPKYLKFKIPWYRNS